MKHMLEKVKFDNGDVIVSFDAVSLFTTVPTNVALNIIKEN